MADTTQPKTFMPESEPAVGWGAAVKVVVLMVVIGACVLAVRLTPWREFFETPEWRQQLQESMGAWLPAIYVAAGTPIVAAGFPRIWYSWLGGALFGFTMGTVWGHAATMTGSMACFWFAQWMGREWVDRKFGRRFHRLERHLRDEGFRIMLLVRLCPIGNNFVTNCLAGASAIRGWPFFWASLIGHFPMTVFFALWGSGLIKGEDYKTAMGLAGMVVFVVAFVIYFRTSRTARQLAREIRGVNGNSHQES